MAAEPGRATEIELRLGLLGGQIADRPSLRFVIVWETDTNDVDLHVYDRQGGHAFYQRPELASGGRLHADVTTGYGPEGYVIDGEPRGFPYVLQAHYYARGAMGYGMGKL